MKPNNIFIRLAILIIPLELLAAGAGLFWQGMANFIRFDSQNEISIDNLIAFANEAIYAERLPKRAVIECNIMLAGKFPRLIKNENKMPADRMRGASYRRTGTLYTNYLIMQEIFPST